MATMNDVKAPPRGSTAEERAGHVKAAKAGMRLEGLQTSSASEQIFKEYIAGTIEVERLVDVLYQRLGLPTPRP
jgi:hypothetical protein